MRRGFSSGIGAGAALAMLSLAGRARGDGQPLRAHATLGVAHAIGAPQSREFGIGGAGAASLELPLGRALGIEGKVGAIVLAAGDAPTDPAFAKGSAGTVLLGTAGLRVRPLSSVAGPWASVGGGFAQTGNRARLGIDAALGYDFRLGEASRWDIGPFVGFTQVVQPDDSTRPNDARIAVLGLHVGLGAAPPRAEQRKDRDKDGVFDDEDACLDVPGIRTSDPKTNGCPRGDRDKDAVFDDEDACPDAPGVRATDPKANGCPPTDGDNDAVLDSEDACPDVPGLRTDDPKTSGCPPPDRDGDGVLNDEDACPDVPGVRMLDPKTNGCPPASETIRVEKDKIHVDEEILFDLDSPRIRHASWAAVKKLAEFIDATPDILEVSIEGHADATGSERHNMTLSLARAESMKTLLVKYGVDPSRIKAEAFGRSRLKVQTSRAEAANRRVELWITRTRPAGSGARSTPPSPPGGTP